MAHGNKSQQPEGAARSQSPITSNIRFTALPSNVLNAYDEIWQQPEVREAEDRFQNNTKRKKPTDSRVAMVWVIESIEKVLGDEGKELWQRKGRYSDNSGRNIISSSQDDNCQLLNILYEIPKVQSKKDAQTLEQEIMGLGIERKYSFAVQERVLKLVSMAGYVKVSLHLLDSMLGLTHDEDEHSTLKDCNKNQNIYIPSYMAYISLLNRLRKWKKVDLMREILEKLSNACEIKGQELHVVALNTFLAALCDQMRITSEENVIYDLMEEAMSLLESGVAAERYRLPNPDVMSFNTVLNAAAELRNETLMEDIMYLMGEQGLTPDTVTYNALLKAAPTAELKVPIVEKIINAPGLVADRFTVEMSLVPLVQKGKVSTMMNLIQNFCSYTHPPYRIQNAFSTFLYALVKSGEIDAARAVFDTFLLSPSLEQCDSTVEFVKKVKQAQGMNLNFIFIKPITRHFNALLEGYKMLNDPFKSIQNTTSVLSPSEHAQTLLDNMKAMNVSPDCFTLTLLMGLQSNSKEITQTWNTVMEISDFMVEPPAYHSLMTAYGKVGDAASACYVFNQMIASACLSHTSWCVLLSALAKASTLYPQNIIDCNSCNGAELNMETGTVHVKPFQGKDFMDIVNGYTYPQAAKNILDLMSSSNSKTIETLVPRPNSQAYCLVASAFSHTDGVGPDFAITMFRNATVNGQKVDGRFLNAIIRCYGDNIASVLDAWKTIFRPAVSNSLREDVDRSSSNFQKSRLYKNLLAAYHGLIYVAGRAYRPDIALRIVYAMAKEGVEPTEAALNTYHAGAKERREDIQKVRLHGQYENLLSIECTKYDSRDKRRLAEKRVRIIF